MTMQEVQVDNGKEKERKEDIKHSLFPNAFIEADGAFRDGNVPAAVGRPRLDCGHRCPGCDPKVELKCSAASGHVLPGGEEEEKQRHGRFRK